MPVSLSQYRGGVGVFNSQFVCYKQFNFFYSDFFRILNIPAVNSVSFLLIFIYVFMKLLVPNGLTYIFLSRKNIKNINSFVSRGLYTLMLATYIRHIWFCSILLTLSIDIEKNAGPKPSSWDKFSLCHWNLNIISVHNFIEISLLRAHVSTNNFDILCLSKTYLDSSISNNNNSLTYQVMIYIEQITHPTLNLGGLYLLQKFSAVESNRHSITIRVHQLRKENREKVM